MQLAESDIYAKHEQALCRLVTAINKANLATKNSDSTAPIEDIPASKQTETSEKPMYSLENHKEKLHRYQNILDTALIFLKALGLDKRGDNKERIRKFGVDGKPLIDLSLSLIFENIAYVSMYRPKATNEELMIEFNPQTGKVTDSAQFTGKTYDGVGHIQAYWPAGMDETYILDSIEFLIAADGEWQLV